MSTIALHDEHNHDHADHGHHKETLISKYIFSMDHKMIAKQFLITGLINLIPYSIGMARSELSFLGNILR
jgi:hypothetical protein